MKVERAIRRVDDLGRISIPKDLRRKVNIQYGDEIEILVVNGLIILSKVEESEANEDA